MVQLVFLLLGARAIKRQWFTLALIGAGWTMLGVAIAVDPLDGVQDITMHTLGVLLLLEGAVVLLLGFLADTPGWRWVARAGALVLAGLAIIDTPWRNVVLVSVIFGMGLLIDGAMRLLATLLVRFEGWRVAVAAAIAEFILALLAFTPWPVSYQATVPFCCGLALVLSGWTIMRSALLLRDLPADAPVTSMPIFSQQRGWRLPLILAGPSARPPPAVDDDGKRMIVHVWTPIGGAAHRTVRRPVIDRYVAAVDTEGTISTGHASLEMQPDLYISHYPAEEIDRDTQAFRETLLATARNDVAGRFLPSYPSEVAAWREATEHVEFRRFDSPRLRAFWDSYRLDTTYNLTNRNCSVVVAMALDIALEGALERPRIWPRMLALAIHPDLHIATLLRKRASSMTWTPGLVLDYARALQRVVQPEPLSWIEMSRQAAIGIRRIRRRHPKPQRTDRKSAA